MKKLTFFTAMFIACTSFAQVPNYVSTNGLVGWWPFNGNANDESGNGNNGTVNGASLTSDRNGIANKAYSFDGIDDYIEYQSGNTMLNITSDFTICNWLKTTDNSGMLLSFSNFINTPYPGYSTGINGGNVGNGKFSAGVNGDNYGANNVINDNQWHFIVVKLESNIIYFYHDNVLINTISNINLPLSYSGPRVLGCRNDLFMTSLANYSGLIDDLSIYSRGLTQQEITNLYNGVYNLPVELKQFSASCSENTTNINWQTATEHNSAYFEVLKSRDGESWNSLTTVNAAGNSSEAINYSIKDDIDATTVYYKLNQVDKDGKSQEYGPISANCNENTSLFISPNPTNGEFNLIGMEHCGTITSLEVKDATGKVVKAMQPTTTQFTCTELKAGVYFLAVSAGKTMKVIKIIKE
jgi:hypothetical protein